MRRFSSADASHLTAGEPCRKLFARLSAPKNPAACGVFYLCAAPACGPDQRITSPARHQPGSLGAVPGRPRAACSRTVASQRPLPRWRGADSCPDAGTRTVPRGWRPGPGRPGCRARRWAGRAGGGKKIDPLPRGLFLAVIPGPPVWPRFEGGAPGVVGPYPIHEPGRSANTLPMQLPTSCIGGV